MTSARSYFFALVITAAAMASRNIAAQDGSRLTPPHDSGPPPASSPSIVCASTLRTLGGPNEIRAALIEGMVKFFRDSQIDSDRLREFLRDPLAAQINWNSGADLNSHAQAIALFQKFARDLPPAEQSQLITDLTAALQTILAARETSQIIAQKSLERTAEIPLVTVFNAQSHIYSIAVFPDGKWILTGHDDGTARLWDLETGREIMRLLRHSRPVTSVSISSDGQHILTASGDSTAVLQDSKIGRELRKFHGHHAWISSAAFSPNGEFILTGSWDKTARLWNSQTGHQGHSFDLFKEKVRSVAFSPDGRHIVTGFFDGIAILWNLETKNPTVLEGHFGRVVSISFSPSGELILTGSWDKTARLWHAKTCQQVRIFQGHRDSVTSVAFSPNGNYILTGCIDKTAKLWNARTGEELDTFRGHRDIVTSVAFLPNGRSIVTGSWDGTARLWPLPPQFWPRPQSTEAAAP